MTAGRVRRLRRASANCSTVSKEIEWLNGIDRRFEGHDVAVVEKVLESEKENLKMR
jgi:hypothetical protein